MFSSPLMFMSNSQGASLEQYVVNLETDTNDVDLHALVAAQGWDEAEIISVVCFVSAGVYILGSSAATPALDTGIFPAGSLISLVNDGFIFGGGGVGGNGSPWHSGFPTAGSAGGVALNLQHSVTIHNSAGRIVGGSGGGGGSEHVVGRNSGGNGGGGGAPNGAGGAAGPAGDPSKATQNGQPGTLLAGGVGGPLAFFVDYYVGDGGAGGMEAGSGSFGVASCGRSPGPGLCEAGLTGAGAAGGSPGKAIELNGNTAEFIGVGSNPPSVVGVVS